MIQEKDFLYRVPVKTSPITTPGGQIRNPEILVDIEGGEFMHGNILDANSTNKLINQSVDNKITEGGYVTKNLLDAETARATAKENEIKVQVDIINGDSTTEGSFRKAIADVVAAAPEDLDTLKEIADKLADNDDLHTALNQAITDKADASALLNEVTRATGVENNLQAAIDTKADATALSSYVLTAALNQQVDTLNTAINAKQDAGNYIPYNSVQSYDMNNYNLYIANKGDAILFNGKEIGDIYADTLIDIEGVKVKDNKRSVNITKEGIEGYGYNGNQHSFAFSLSDQGIRLREGDNNHVLTSYASTIDITQYALKTELPTVPTKTSQLTNDSNFITADDVDNDNYTLFGQLKFGLENNGQLIIDSGGIRSDVGGGFSLFSDGISFDAREHNEIPTANGDFINIDDYALNSQVTALEQTVTANTTAIEGKQDKGDYVTYSSKDGNNYYLHRGLVSSEPFAVDDSYGKNVEYGINGIVASAYSDCLATSDGSFKPIFDFVLKSEGGREYVTYGEFASVKAGLNSKQNKITVNSVDVTDIETADAEKLRTIVTNLTNALSESGLIRLVEVVE